MVIAVLKGEGIVEGRAGSGVYVRDTTRLVRLARCRDVRSGGDGPTSPFARDAAGAGQHGTWEYDSRHQKADERIAARLGIEPGTPVMRTSYRFLADGEPIQLSVPYEPLALTEGAPIEWPEDGSVKGVVARMEAIGVRVDEVVERVSLRSATAEEVEALNLPARTIVHTIERTYTAGGTPVESADIMLPGGRNDLVYRLPID
ncbi:UTRA domain-containing protein [Micromonospora marina]|uniref:UTRA domain-containing protein n=1 Tax=Micromonospora marina TaxID=307120 RepID=UPI003454A61D